MPVDVSWDGVPLARAATAREQEGGWFVELEQPMPVGTRVTLSGDVQLEAVVARVHEGLGAGMLLSKADARAAAATATAPATATGESADEPKTDNGGGGEKKEKRKKRR